MWVEKEMLQIQPAAGSFQRRLTLKLFRGRAELVYGLVYLVLKDHFSVSGGFTATGGFGKEQRVNLSVSFKSDWTFLQRLFRIKRRNISLKTPAERYLTDLTLSCWRIPPPDCRSVPEQPAGAFHIFKYPAALVCIYFPTDWKPAVWSRNDALIVNRDFFKIKFRLKTCSKGRTKTQSGPLKRLLLVSFKLTASRWRCGGEYSGSVVVLVPLNP